MTILKPTYLVALLLACALPVAVQAASTPHWVHYKLLKSQPKLPKKLVILPINVDVMEVTAGDVKEEVPEWSAEASKNIHKSLSNIIKQNTALRKVSMPRLSRKSSAVVNEHMALYNLVVNTWRNESGNLWEPNDFIEVYAPSAFVYEPYSFMIRGVEFSKDSNGFSATLNLVLPGSFSNSVPDILPWNP